ncbi:MAG: HAD-IA family hydrolase [Rhizobiaceae bacterium]|nr:HAD-IA family hydrolase [Rhizobiaceae bacterium]
MTKIDHIVFDIGRVLIHWDPELVYLDLIPDADERQYFLSHICSPDWNLEQDRGRDWREAEDLLIADHPEKARLIRAYRGDWIKSVPHAYEDVAEVYAELIDAGHDLTLLTNFNQHTFLEAKEKFGFLTLARGETVSGDVRLVKPDAAIYAHHTSQHELNPATTLFIDDSANNIAAARQFGWQAIHFAGLEGAPKLRAELAAYGLDG